MKDLEPLAAATLRLAETIERLAAENDRLRRGAELDAWSLARLRMRLISRNRTIRQLRGDLADSEATLAAVQRSHAAGGQKL